MNIAKILKDCPKGTELYSPLFGEVTLDSVNDDVIYITWDNEYSTYECFYPNGKYYDTDNGECLLFPSKDNRDWSTFNVSKKRI